MSLAAGDLDRQIRIQQLQGGQSSTGQPVKVWVDVAKPWASIKGQTGMGAIRGAAEGLAVAVKLYSFRIRYRPGVTEAMRVFYGGQPYDITAVRHDLDRREWTDLVCQLGGSDG